MSHREKRGINSRRNLLSMFAMTAMFSEHDYQRTDSNVKIIDQDKLDKQKKNRDKYMKGQGIMVFKYGDHEIKARSKKNADKKARKKGYLK